MTDLKKRGVNNPARRHFLGLATAAASRVAGATAFGWAAALTSCQVGGANNGNHSSHDGNNTNHYGQNSNNVTFSSNTRNNGNRSASSSALCFLRGTRISTDKGEVPIEDLCIGDLVETIHGERAPIKWIGRQVFKKSRGSWTEAVMPIRVSRFALDEQTPHRDLYLSPWHSLLIDGFLMPVKELVNGVSIHPAMPPGRQAIEYFQILLDSHEMVLAEDAPAESLLIRTGEEYEMFTNFIEYERLYGSARPLMKPFAPMSYHASGTAHLIALLRLGASTVVDVRNPAQVAYQRIAQRAKQHAFF